MHGKEFLFAELLSDAAQFALPLGEGHCSLELIAFAFEVFARMMSTLMGESFRSDPAYSCR